MKENKLLPSMEKNAIRIGYLPIRYHLPVMVILIISILSGSLNNDVVGTLALLMTFSGLMGWVGRKIPILGEWLGGEILLPLLGGSFLGSFGLLPPTIISGVDTFMSSGFVNLIVGAAIAGAILTIDKNKAKDILITVLPSAIIAIACAFLFMLFGSWIVGNSILEGVYLTGLPNFCGGTTSCLVSIPSICSSVLGGDASDWSGRFMITVVLTNTLCICGASILGRWKKSSMKKANEETAATVAACSTHEYNIAGLSQGCIVSVMVLVTGALLSHFFPFLNYVSWATIFTLLLKFFDLVDQKTAQCVASWQEVLLGLFVPTVLLGCGISNIDLRNVATYVSGAVLLITFLGVCGSIFGAFVAARLFHHDPLDMMIGIGCNTATLGGTGNVAVLSSAKRMDLMTYATITCRIGGAIVLIIYDVSIRMFI